MANNKINFVDVPTQTSISVRVFDNGDDTFSFAFAQKGYDSQYISTAATTVVASAAIYIDNIRCIGGTLGLVTIYKGSTLDPVYCAEQPAVGQVLGERLHFENGLTIVTAAATELVVTFRLGG